MSYFTLALFIAMIRLCVGLPVSIAPEVEQNMLNFFTGYK